MFVCLSKNAIMWLAISYAYKGLLQLVAMFMAFHTRRVKIKALNDSKEIAVIVYVNSIILVLLAVVDFALNRYYEVYTALFGLALLLEATVFLTLNFIPKVRLLAFSNSLLMFKSQPSERKIKVTSLVATPTSVDYDMTSSLQGSTKKKCSAWFIRDSWQLCILALYTKGA